MKKLLCSLLVFGTVSSAFAGCIWEYEHKGLNRDLRNSLLVITAGSIGAAALPVPLAVITVVGINIYPYELSHRDNKFEKLGKVLTQAYLSKLSGEELLDFHQDTREFINEKYKFDISLDETVALLNEANKSEVICPVVKIKKNGIEKRAVFNRKTLIRYIGELAEKKKDEEIIRRIGSN
jgi:hypothetical protein